MVNARVDDITFGEMPDDLKAEHVVEFNIDGEWWSIDLSPRNLKVLRDTLAPYLSCARRRPEHSGVMYRDRCRKIRDWARANGYPIAERGRISREIRDAYTAAQEAS